MSKKEKPPRRLARSLGVGVSDKATLRRPEAAQGVGERDRESGMVEARANDEHEQTQSEIPQQHAPLRKPHQRPRLPHVIPVDLPLRALVPKRPRSLGPLHSPPDDHPLQPRHADCALQPTKDTVLHQLVRRISRPNLHPPPRLDRHDKALERETRPGVALEMLEGGTRLEEGRKEKDGVDWFGLKEVRLDAERERREVRSDEDEGGEDFGRDGTARGT